MIYKFDTDFWREDEKFQNVLEEYNINSIPTLIKIDSDGKKQFLEFDTKDENEIQIVVRDFLYN